MRFLKTSTGILKTSTSTVKPVEVFKKPVKPVEVFKKPLKLVEVFVFFSIFNVYYTKSNPLISNLKIFLHSGHFFFLGFKNFRWP